MEGSTACGCCGSPASWRQFHSACRTQRRVETLVCPSHKSCGRSQSLDRYWHKRKLPAYPHFRNGSSAQPLICETLRGILSGLTYWIGSIWFPSPSHTSTFVFDNKNRLIWVSVQIRMFDADDMLSSTAMTI